MVWWITKLKPRGVLLGILGGGVPPGSSNPDPISDQKKILHTCFQTRPKLAEIMLSLLRLEHKKKILQIHFECAYFFLSHSFGIETINAFIHSYSSLENHTWFQTKMGKVYTRFQTKRAQKPQSMGRHIMAYIRKYPPGRGATAIYGLYRYVPLWRLWFSSSLL